MPDYGPELIYCPFCGGQPHYVQRSFPNGDYKVQVQCTVCDVLTAAVATKDREGAYKWAAQRWNGRVDGPDYTEEESDEDNRDGDDKEPTRIPTWEEIYTRDYEDES